MGALLAGIAGLMVIAGCAGKSNVKPKEKKQQVRVWSFSEPGPVRRLMVAQSYVFSAFERGLDRWELGSGQNIRLNAEHGLPGDRVEALSFDDSRGWLWVATSGGLTRYELEMGTFAELKQPPVLYGMEDWSSTVLTPAGDGGLWVGHRRGLFYTTADGKWTDTGITTPVDALLRTRDGWLWIGTTIGLVGRRPIGGETIHFGQSRGCDLTKVDFVASTPADSPLIVGENAAGEQRIVLIVNEQCVTYRAAPDERWLSADRRAGELVILTSRRLYSLRMRTDDGPSSLSREGMRLVHVPVVEGEEPQRSPYVLEPIELSLPTGALTVAATDREILVGTRSLGTARFAVPAQRTDSDSRDKPQARWLRRSLLVQEARSLSVVCMEAKDCFVSTGARPAWRFRGDSFEPVEIAGTLILAFVRSASGDVYALARSPDTDTAIVAYRNTDGEWARIADLVIRVPGRQAEVSFARFAPTGMLWVGLRYHDESGTEQPHGVALVDMEIGAVAYHHAAREEKHKKKGILPIPVGTVDIAFLEDQEVWLATTEGAVLVRGEDVTVFTEADGLESELLRGVAMSAGGIVFIATSRGISSFDGSEWTFPKLLRWPVNDVEAGPDGRLWMATDRGVAVFDGAKVRRLDQHRGLLENKIDAIALDHLGRIWARGSQGITVITP